MREIPSAFWQHSIESDASPRFVVGALREVEDAGGEQGSERLESLRADVIVVLFNHLTAASIARPHLAPFLMDALDNAVIQLLNFRHQSELCAVQEWLSPEWRG